MASLLVAHALYAAPAVDASTDPNKVNFLAQTLSYNENTQVITAEGDVEIAQDGRIVRAQRVIYNLPEDKVEAVGQVVMMDASGDVHFAERVELTTKLKEGYIKALKSFLADGSRMTAVEGNKTDDKTIMQHATYTACEECKKNPDQPALWRIVADEVTHDKHEKSIAYKNAKFQVYNVPVFYMPYFSHSDGSVKQKSGFLAPKLSLNSRLGFGLASKYYWGISPSEDATIGARVFTKNNPQLTAEYRKRFANAQVGFDSSATYSDSDTKNEFRGHMFGKGLWDVNSKWRVGFGSQLVTDDTYLNEYNLPRENVLENQIYAERFEGRNYFVGRALSFQDIRTSNRSTDQPNILPEMQASFIGKPNAFLGGRWEADFSSLTLARLGAGQDMLRNSAGLGWERHAVTAGGLVNTFSLHARLDSYNVADRDVTLLGSGAGDSASFRFYPVLHDVMSYPLAKDMGGLTRAVIEPSIALTLAPNVKNSTDIPNEDSQDVQIDVSNLFDANRFSGLDRVEDNVHVTYGVRAGLYKNDHNTKNEIFVGQSFRFDNQRNPFPDGSGLSEQNSDFVGQFITEYENLYGLNYRFQVDANSLRPVRHEIIGNLDLNKVTLNGTYFYSRQLEGTDLQGSRQQLYGVAQYALNDEWNLMSGARYDMTEGSKGLRFSEFGLEYTGQCFNILTQARRKFTDNDTGDNATEITVQLGLKNIGTFSSND